MVISDFINGYSSRESIKNFCDAITRVMLQMKQNNDDLVEENRRLKDENYKDEELAKLSKELKNLENECYRGFPISKKENEEIITWQKQHDINVHRNYDLYHGAIGGGYSYRFYPTSIGCIGTCICDTCAARAREVASSDGHYNKDKYREYMEKVNGSFDFQDIV